MAALAPPKKKHRSPWIWVSAVLVLVATGLLIWGITTQNDLDEANQETAAVKAVAGDMAEQAEATSDDLAATEQAVEEAEEAAAKAQQDADAAKDDAADAQDATAQAQAEADQAKAEAEAAQSKQAIAADCAKAYVSALGSLFEGESVKEQAEVVRKELQGISEQCQAALADA